MKPSSPVLVTGSAGRIGRAVVKELQERGHVVRGLDLVPTPGLKDAFVGGITDVDLVRRAMAGVGALVHLAATPDDDDFLKELAPNNLIGVYHVFEAARLAGVKRLVLASSGQVVWYQRTTGPWPIRVDGPTSPRYWYAATKAFLEAAGRGFAETHGMSVIVARLGWCPRTKEQARELAATDWAKDVYFSPGDAGRFFAQAVEAPKELHFAIVYAMSKPTNKMLYDPVPARDLLGYEGRDTFPQGVEDMLT